MNNDTLEHIGKLIENDRGHLGSECDDLMSRILAIIEEEQPTLDDDGILDIYKNFPDFDDIKWPVENG